MQCRLLFFCSISWIFHDELDMYTCYSAHTHARARIDVDSDVYLYVEDACRLNFSPCFVHNTRMLSVSV